MTSFDRRLTPARSDLAADFLKGQVEAPRFVQGRRRRVDVPVLDLRARPAQDCPLDTQALMGEIFNVYDEEEGWAWGQLQTDGYVGYVSADGLAAESDEPSLRVSVPRTFVYPGPNMKLPAVAALSMGARVAATGGSGPFTLTRQGAVWTAHLDDDAATAGDYVSIAEQFIGVPYLWGGRTSLGLDCSGLVQLSMMMAGVASPRDTDMMERGLGHAIEPGEDLRGLRRGDLVFWKGHVGIMQDGDTLLHANGHHMLVVSESLRGARERILNQSYGAITSFRRL